MNGEQPSAPAGPTGRARRGPAVRAPLTPSTAPRGLPVPVLVPASVTPKDLNLQSHYRLYPFPSPPPWPRPLPSSRAGEATAEGLRGSPRPPALERRGQADWWPSPSRPRSRGGGRYLPRERPLRPRRGRARRRQLLLSPGTPARPLATSHSRAPPHRFRPGVGCFVRPTPLPEPLRHERVTSRPLSMTSHSHTRWGRGSLAEEHPGVGDHRPGCGFSGR